MNIGVHMSLSILVSSVCIPSSGIAGSYDSSVSSFLCGAGIALAMRSVLSQIEESALDDFNECSTKT